MGGIQKQLKQQSSTRCQQNVGILTFYQEQKQLIEKKLKCLDLPTNTYKVKTVDSSQGYLLVIYITFCVCIYLLNANLETVIITN